jgi:hypothetical protein
VIAIPSFSLENKAESGGIHVHRVTLASLVRLYGCMSTLFFLVLAYILVAAVISTRFISFIKMIVMIIISVHYLSIIII